MFINMDLGKIVEPKAVDPGRYGLTISSAEYREAKHDIRVSLGIHDHLEAQNVSHYISLPKPDDDPAKAQFKQLMLKRFLQQFSIVYNEGEGFNTEDFSGATGTAMLTLSEPDDSGNVYNRLQLDKMGSEK